MFLQPGISRLHLRFKTQAVNKIKQKYILLFAALGLIVLSVNSCSKDNKTEPGAEVLKAEEGEEYSGGSSNTVFDVSTNAFSFSSPGLMGNDELEFFVGNSFFKQNWVTAPASTTARDGLGPTFNARACASCHLKDGRGAPPSFNGELSTGLLVRLSVPGTDMFGGPNPDPNYGDQLNDQAIPGIPHEGTVQVSYSMVDGTFDDGETYQLQAPAYSIADLGYGAFVSGIMMSPRVGQQVVGLGLLEAIDEATLLSLADEYDANGDGISGRPNYVWDFANNKTRIGRFGWKANQPSLLQQTVGALLGDMGITSYLFPNQNCTGIQTGCQGADNGGNPEIEDKDLQKVVLYITNLAVPARRNFDDKTVLQGKQLFMQVGCASCHIPKLVTGTHPRFANLSNQTIRPYTDLLLHDMGPALADNRPDYKATGSEWRTPPLWGIGLVNTVNNHTRFLHDGRARNIEEAVLWHGGEAEKSRNNYKALTKNERQAIIQFLNSL